MRTIDVDVAEHILGFVTKTIKPSWYRYDVILFFRPNEPLIEYSWDENSCNAMMYRNGKDDTDGTAPSLPFYSDDMREAWKIVSNMQTNEEFIEAMKQSDVWRLDSSDAARLICETALRCKR